LTKAGGLAACYHICWIPSQDSDFCWLLMSNSFGVACLASLNQTRSENMKNQVGTRESDVKQKCWCKYTLLISLSEFLAASLECLTSGYLLPAEHLLDDPVVTGHFKVSVPVGSA